MIATIQGDDYADDQNAHGRHPTGEASDQEAIVGGVVGGSAICGQKETVRVKSRLRRELIHSSGLIFSQLKRFCVSFHLCVSSNCAHVSNLIFTLPFLCFTLPRRGTA